MRLCGPGSSDAGHSISYGAVGFYNPRRATETPFYQLVAGHVGEFKRVYAEKYERDFGFWRGVIDDVVRKFLECGDLAHGFARVRCGDCGHEMFVAFSCKQRGFCPSCHQKRTLNLSFHLSADVCAAVPHRQFVFTIPKRFRLFFRHRRSLLGKLAQCAWRTVRDVYANVLGKSAVPGMVVAIQTFGELIHWHPHIHALVTDGAFLPDGVYLPLPVIPADVFLKVWEHHVFKMLLQEHRIDEDTVASMQTWRHSGFSVHKDVRIAAGDTNGIEKLAQYIARCPFSQARMLKVNSAGHVLYRAEHSDPRDFPHWRALPTIRTLSRNFELFDPLDFLAQITQHIPNRGEHQVRYYGWYSNKSRGVRAKAAKSAVPLPDPSDTDTLGAHEKSHAHLRWAALIKKVYEIDPLVCPKCGATMKIIAFIEDPRVIRKILDHIGHSPPPSRAPPPEDAAAAPHLVAEPFFDDLPWGSQDAAD